MGSRGEIQTCGIPYYKGYGSSEIREMLNVPELMVCEKVDSGIETTFSFFSG